MNEHDEQVQQALHEAIELAVFDPGLDDAEPEDAQRVLTGWLVIFETASLSRAEGGPEGTAGHFYGPREMTTWRALGLVEWARRFGLVPDSDE